MKDKNLIRTIALTLAFTIIFNFCESVPLSILFNKKEAEAATTINTTIINGLWSSRKTEVGLNADNTPQSTFWKNTAECSTNWIDTDKHTIGTRADDVMEKSLGMPINTINGSVETKQGNTVNNYAFEDNVETGQKIRVYTDYNDKENFNTEISNEPLISSIPENPAKNDPLQQLYYTVEKDDMLGGYYRKYYISTANQLQYLLFVSLQSSNSTNTSSNTASYTIKNEYGDELDPANDEGVHSQKFIKTTTEEIAQYYDEKGTPLNKLGIELLCDIDLGGANSQYWLGFSNTGIITEIEGNNHTIYNGHFLKVVSAKGKNSTQADAVGYRYYTFFNGSDQSVNGYNHTFNSSAYRFALKNINFSNMYIQRDGGIFGNGTQFTFMENVNFHNSISSAATSSSAICFGNSYQSAYFKNCMTRNCYVYSTGGHSSTFASYNGGSYYDNKNSAGGKFYTYIGDPTPADDIIAYYFKNVPEAGYAELSWLGNTTNYKTAIIDGKNVPLTAYYPSIYENCMSIDSEVYDAGGEHSGTFVSCMQSCIIFKNCFTNSIIYARSKAGCFIGCCIGCGDGFYYEVDGEKSFVNAYFENCYSSGLIEGADNEGGFIGSIYNDARAYGSNNNTPTRYRGKCVFKNCYSTTSVGMQFSRGTNIGGFVGCVVGNGWAQNEEDTQHIFTNCYAAGEVGGIETDTSTDTANTNTTGGFMGSYPSQLYSGKTDTEFAENQKTMQIEPKIENCFYDKQTTAMRERDIGGKKAADNTPLNNTLSGLKGVYTLSSQQKNVAGLADTVNFGDGKWTYQKGYYPELSAFMDKEAENNFGTKAETASLYSRASVATVFLDHWDSIMDINGNVAPTDLTAVYDTVRDISSKFEFSSGGNSAVSNIGWQLNDEKNKQSNLHSYLGGTDENGSPIGFSIAFGYTNRQGGTSQVTQKYTPQVISIMADKESNGDYSFKCFDFSEGKQFVKVTTCTDEDYAKWKNEQDKYNSYLDAVDEFELARPKYVKLLGSESAALTDEDIRTGINSLLNKQLNINADTVNEEIIKARLDNVKNLTNKLTSEDSDEKLNAAEELNSLLSLKHDPIDETAAEAIYSHCAQFFQYNVYPFAEPAEVKAPTDFKSYINGRFGTRTLRLVPTAYLDAGNMITVNVSDTIEGGTTTKVTNDISMTIDGVTISPKTFDHTIGVAYSSTQGYQNISKGASTRLGNDTLYNGQILKQNSDAYYDLANNVFVKNKLGYDDNADGDFTDAGEALGDSVFALYDVYPSVKADSIKGSDIDITSGFTSLADQTLLGNFCKEPNGKTKVEVYTTEMAEVQGSDGTGFVLEKNEKIDMTNQTNLQKWTGQAPFTESDKGYYYMVYYWRMDDGRYLEENKLVKITANQFSVQMRTGVAGAEEDSFVYKKNDTGENDVYYTAIDCDVFSDFDSQITEEQNVQRHYFPSDRYYYPKQNGKYADWTDFSQKTYDYYGDYLNYNEGEYWTKSMTATTTANQVCVAWRKNTEYALVKLMIEVNVNNKWIPMAITGTTDHDTDLEDQSPEFYYTYKSYDVTQNTKTKKFSVIATDNVVKTFVASNALDSDTKEQTGSFAAGAGSVRYINFKFIDESADSRQLEYNNDIRVTALFRTVGADIRAKETVLIDDGKAETELVKADTGYIALDAAEMYRSVDNLGAEETDKKAVLFGDKLIYRKKIQNIGHYNANDVVLTQTVPEGLTLVNGSVKLYKQGRTINSNSEDEYADLEEVSLTELDSLNDIANKSYSDYTCCYAYDETEGKIYYRLNPVNMTEDYYLSFKAVTDKNYTAFEKSYSTYAGYGYVYINGDVPEGTEIADLNAHYAENAVFNTMTDETINKDGSITYNININRQDKTNNVYYLRNMINTVPDGYKLDTGSLNVKFTDEDDLKEFTIKSSNAEFSISANENTNYILGLNKTINITYTVKPDAETNTNGRISNSFVLTYAPSTDVNNKDQNSVTRVTDVTNTVESEARWLYINVEKTIDGEDPTQSFLFRIMNYTKEADDKYIFADINCTESNGNDGFKGSQIIQIDERGFYDVTETDWACTDYDLSKTLYTSMDIDLANAGSGENDAKAQPSSNNGFYLPRAMYKSTAFPLWAVEARDADNSTETIYPTVSCHNTESEYAWLSTQTHVENSFANNGGISTASRAGVPISKEDEPVSSQAINTETIKIKKGETEE